MKRVTSALIAILFLVVAAADLDAGCGGRGRFAARRQARMQGAYQSGGQSNGYQQGYSYGGCANGQCSVSVPPAPTYYVIRPAAAATYYAVRPAAAPTYYAVR